MKFYESDRERRGRLSQGIFTLLSYCTAFVWLQTPSTGFAAPPDGATSSNPEKSDEYGAESTPLLAQPIQPLIEAESTTFGGTPALDLLFDVGFGAIGIGSITLVAGFHFLSEAREHELAEPARSAAKKVLQARSYRDRSTLLLCTGSAIVATGVVLTIWGATPRKRSTLIQDIFPQVSSGLVTIHAAGRF